MKRITITDIAQKAGVSVGTVHCALAGKPGVGMQKRQHIIDIAQRYDYHPNAAAASLKRKTVRLAAAFPKATKEDQFYFGYFWDGLRDYLHSMDDYNIEIVEAPYYDGHHFQTDEFENWYERSPVDGLISALSYLQQPGKDSIQRLIDTGVPVALVGEDLPQSGRLCCIQPNYNMVGKVVAELLARQIPPDSSVLLCAGDPSIASHYQIVHGFETYLGEYQPKNRIYKIYANQVLHEEQEQIAYELREHENICGCFSVTARGSVMLGNALEQAGKIGRMAAVGSDMFEENFAFLRKGVFTNLLNKNPYLQAYKAAAYLVEFLLREVRPPEECLFVGSEIVFQSNLPMYMGGSDFCK